MGEIIRKTKSGKFIGWYLRYVDADGRRKQRASKQPSHADAKRMLIEIEARIARGLVGMEERGGAAAMTLEALGARFIAEYRDPRVKDLDAYQQRTSKHLKRISKQAPQLARLALSAVTATTIARLREALLQRYPAGTVRTTLSSLIAALNWAVREGLLRENPGKGARLPPSPPPRLDFLTADEVSRLLAEVERRANTLRNGNMWWARWVAVSLAVRAGLRKGEVFGLRWQDVDLDAQRLTVARSYGTTPKSGKARHLRLPSALLPLLKKWRERCPHPTLVCPIHRNTERRWDMAVNSNRQHGLPEVLCAAGCRVFTRPWHLLRHTFASHFMMSGGNLLALSQILGHTDVKITMIYAHLSSDYLAEQIDKVKF
jgi:integrase